MNARKIDGNDIKHALLQKGMTLKAFAEKYDYSYRLTSEVVRGINKGSYGKGREILEKLREVANEDQAAEAIGNYPEEPVNVWSLETAKEGSASPFSAIVIHKPTDYKIPDSLLEG